MGLLTGCADEMNQGQGCEKASSLGSSFARRVAGQ